VADILSGTRSGGPAVDDRRTGAGLRVRDRQVLVGAAGAALQVMGIDQCAGMLGQATRKHPGVAVRVLALQDLAGTADLLGRFDGLLCVDALEASRPSIGRAWPLGSPVPCAPGRLPT